MSIDARIVGLSKMQTGQVRLSLEPRNNSVGPAGQEFLYCIDPPVPFPLVVGDEIWGNASRIMRRDTWIARRVGLTWIEFVDQFDGIPRERY